MQKILTFVFSLFLSLTALAQSPQAVCYQAVATDAAGTELVSRNITVHAKIMQGSFDGTVVRDEMHTVTTDDYGLFNLNIGEGTPEPGSPDFQTIDWGNGPFFLSIDMDPNGGTDFVSLGTSQILSVPYALYSATAGVAQTAADDDDTSPANELQSLQFDPATGLLSLTDSPSPGVNLGSNADADADPENEIQTILFDPATGTLTLSNTTDPGVVIDVNDADADPNNELQNLQFDAATGELSLSDATGAPITINTDDADADPNNELQSVEYDPTTGSLNLSNSPGAAVTIDINDADADPNNELQNLQYDATTGELSLSDAPGAPVTIDTDDADADPNNELQSVEYDPTTGSLNLSNSPGAAVTLDVNDADADPNNELQNIQYNPATGEISLTNAPGAGAVIDINDGDSNPQNEIQFLEFDENTGALTLSGTVGTGVNIPLEDADADPANELQTLTYDPATNGISLSQDNSPPVVINTDDADADPQNEVQSLQYNPTTGGLSLSLDNSPETVIDIDDADADPENEIQTLSFENNSLTISGAGGNTINFGESLFGAPGASFDYPQGIIGEHLVIKNENFVVPSDKVFWLTSGGNNVQFVMQDGAQVLHPNTPNMPVFAGGTTIGQCRCTGMLVNSDPNITPAIADLTDTGAEYVVPANKIFFLKSGLSNAMTAQLKVDGTDMEFLRPNFTRGTRIISFPAGTVIQRPTNSDPGEFVLTGYLITAQ